MNGDVEQKLNVYGYVLATILGLALTMKFIVKYLLLHKYHI